MRSNYGLFIDYLLFIDNIIDYSLLSVNVSRIRISSVCAHVVVEQSV